MPPKSRKKKWFDPGDSDENATETPSSTATNRQSISRVNSPLPDSDFEPSPPPRSTNQSSASKNRTKNQSVNQSKKSQSTKQTKPNQSIRQPPAKRARTTKLSNKRAHLSSDEDFELSKQTSSIKPSKKRPKQYSDSDFEPSPPPRSRSTKQSSPQSSNKPDQSTVANNQSTNQSLATRKPEKSRKPRRSAVEVFADYHSDNGTADDQCERCLMIHAAKYHTCNIPTRDSMIDSYARLMRDIPETLIQCCRKQLNHKILDQSLNDSQRAEIADCLELLSDFEVIDPVHAIQSVNYPRVDCVDSVDWFLSIIGLIDWTLFNAATKLQLNKKIDLYVKMRHAYPKLLLIKSLAQQEKQKQLSLSNNPSNQSIDPSAKTSTPTRTIKMCLAQAIKPEFQSQSYNT
ncbi:hypothetical protein HDU85_007829 [Gaertneriomyces sp. JEL0708]|nr:hypothetical protein HDU85_007829 [Gaertneriomyces sp. JEL0708]